MVERLIAEAEAQSRPVLIVPTASSTKSVSLKIEAPATARSTAAAVQPQPFAPDRPGVAKAIAATLGNATGVSVVWLTDGIDHDDTARDFAERLKALASSGLAVVEAWLALGFDDTCAPSMRHDLSAAGVDRVRTQAELAAVGALPPWLGDESLHRSHRSALLRKDPGWYGPRFPDVPDDLPYVWPVRSAKALDAERRRAARHR